MRIAITTEGSYVSEHFGRCPHYTIVDLEGNKIIKFELIENPGHKSGFMPNFLKQKGVECVICGGIGTKAINYFSELGIKVIMGVTEKIEDVLEKMKKGELEGGGSLCKLGSGKRYGIEKKVCDHKD